MSSALVSVLLPVWNCPQYVGAAIESILSQTYRNFELIIIDDGSTDDTPNVLRRFTDGRIRHHRHSNRGLAGTLNVGMEMARGEFIARQDQDDLSLPDRLEKQVAYLETHESCGLLGTRAQIIEGDTLVKRFHKHATDSALLRFQLLFNNPFVHSSVVMRKSVLDVTGGYTTDPERQPPEDYELWSRISRVSAVANLPDILLQYREIPTSMSRQGPSPFRGRLVKISAENLAAASSRSPSDSDVIAIAALTHGAPEMVAKAPDFRRIQTILTHCAKHAFGQSIPKGVESDIRNKVAALRGGWIVQRGPFAQWTANQGPVRKFLKFVFRAAFRRKNL